MNRPVRIGVQIRSGGTRDYPTWRDAVLRAEDMGVDAVFGYDHFHRPFVGLNSEGGLALLPEQRDVNHFESWTTLGSWAELTTRVEIGTLVTGIGYRNPDLLADMARTVDHISGGRLILGLGAGWYEKDYTVYGYDYGTLAARMRLFAEGLQRIEHRLKHLQPKPLRRIPILIGGSGERKTLRLVGRHAHIWHSLLADIESFRRKNDLVRQHATGAGRDEALIERAIAWPRPAGADDFLAEGVTLFTAGIDPTDDGYDFTPVKEMLAWRGDL